MAAHAVVAAALYCAVVNPAVDKIAGTFPKLLPLQIVATIADVVCIGVLRAPTLSSLLGVAGDVANVIGDLPPRADALRVTLRPPRIGMKR